jgi:hypothetical protein
VSDEPGESGARGPSERFDHLDADDMRALAAAMACGDAVLAVELERLDLVSGDASLADAADFRRMILTELAFYPLDREAEGEDEEDRTP